MKKVISFFSRTALRSLGRSKSVVHLRAPLWRFRPVLRSADPESHQRSVGRGSFETCTIVMKNRIFIPIPPPIQGSFLPHHDEKNDSKIDAIFFTQTTCRRTNSPKTLWPN